MSFRILDDEEERERDEVARGAARQLLDFLGAKLMKNYIHHNSKQTIYIFLPWELEREKSSSLDASSLVPVRTFLCANTDLLSTREQ